MATSSTNHYPSSSARRALLALVAMVAGLMAVPGLTALPAQAQSTPTSTNITVDTDADEYNTDGDCSLREAIKAANTNQNVDGCPAGSASDEDSIGFNLASSSPTTITLAQALGELGVTDSAGLVIDGGDRATVTVSGNDAVRVFFVGEGAKLGLKNLTVAHGKDGYAGGGIFIYGGTLRVDKSTFSQNSASDYGGAINNSGGALEVSASTFSQNNTGGRGAGISNIGSLKVSTSTFSLNNSSFIGGGIFNRRTAMVDNSTFSENSGDGGGGISNADDGKLTATNSTFYKNKATVGGGIDNTFSTLTVINSTFSQNSAPYGGGGILNASGTVRLSNTIVANSTSGGNCSNNQGTITDGGYNIESSTTCGFSQANNSKSSTEPGLETDAQGHAVLKDNGGPTKTIALQPTSPALDAIPPSVNGCGTDIKTDQREVSRPQGIDCDIGAFEIENPNDPPDAVDDAVETPEDTPLNVTVLANDSDPDDPKGDGLTVSDVSDPQKGKATIDQDQKIVTYEPDPDYNGEDSFTYTVSDPQGASDTATVSVRVLAQTDAPVSNEDFYVIKEDTELGVAAPGVLVNDADADGDDLVASVVTGPARGNLALNGDGSFVYTPKKDFSGVDAFTYRASDSAAPNGGGAGDEAKAAAEGEATKVTITVKGAKEDQKNNNKKKGKKNKKKGNNKKKGSGGGDGGGQRIG